jgi:hypothetical protein
MPLPNYVPWSPTVTSLTTALTTATGDDATIGNGLLATLQGLGTAYDALYTAAVDTAKGNGLSAFAAALATWEPTTLASHTQADRAARYAESLQATAQLGQVAQPYAYAGGVLAPTTPIAWSYPDTPIVAAELTLSSAVLVTALTAGAAGNAITVAVNASSDGVAGHFQLVAALGSYTETFDNIVPGTAPTATSLLLAPLVFLTTTRPTNAAAAALAGGSGGTHAAILARLGRALKLPAAAAQIPFLTVHQTAVIAALTAQPAATFTSPYAGETFTIANPPPVGVPIPKGPWLVPAPPPYVEAVNGELLEQAMAAQIASATAWLAQFDGPP